jgi:hypothetical protein
MPVSAVFSAKKFKENTTQGDKGCTGEQTINNSKGNRVEVEAHIGHKSENG